MKLKYSLFIFLVAFLGGCTAPGTYMSGYNVRQYSDLEGRLQQTHIYSIDQNVAVSGKMLVLKPYEYRVGPFDVLSIYVWNHPELTLTSIASAQTAGPSTGLLSAAITQEQGGYPISATGTIYFPYIGEVKVSGLTENEIRQLLIKKLSKYIRDPQITIKITVYQSTLVHMLGEVTKPGQIYLTSKPLSILEALDQAGGINQGSADASQIYVIRGDLNQFVVYWLNAKSPQAIVVAEHFYLMPNDIIYVAPAGVANWNRAVSQIMPTIQSLWMTKVLVTS